MNELHEGLEVFKEFVEAVPEDTCSICGFLVLPNGETARYVRAIDLDILQNSDIEFLRFLGDDMMYQFQVAANDGQIRQR